MAFHIFKRLHNSAQVNDTGSICFTYDKTRSGRLAMIKLSLRSPGRRSCSVIVAFVQSAIIRPDTSFQYITAVRNKQTIQYHVELERQQHGVQNSTRYRAQSGDVDSNLLTALHVACWRRCIAVTTCYFLFITRMNSVKKQAWLETNLGLYWRTVEHKANVIMLANLRDTNSQLIVHLWLAYLDAQYLYEHNNALKNHITPIIFKIHILYHIIEVTFWCLISRQFHSVQAISYLFVWTIIVFEMNVG